MISEGKKGQVAFGKPEAGRVVLSEVVSGWEGGRKVVEKDGEPKTVDGL